MRTAPETANLAALCHDNLEQLDRIDHLLVLLEHDDYARPAGFAEPIGKHLRHVLEHYDSLLGGAEGRIDYDNRPRDPAVETDPRVASEWIAQIRERLCALPESDAPATVEVRYTPAAGAPAVTGINSTLERECHFVLSHTVHHMALIALLCERQGYDVPPEFGVAESTLRYRARQSAAAAAAADAAQAP